MPQSSMHEQNRRSWNYITPIHNSHKTSQAQFLGQGGSTLFPEEVELLGDIAGRRLLHLQCNCGQDSLSMVQLGAHVTGVDISDEAIAFAQQLSKESGVAAQFIRSDVYDWLPQALQAGDRYDVVFASYGALCWLSDLESWARGVFDILAPGGRLVVMEFHPFAQTLDEDWQLRHPYSSAGKPNYFEEGIGDYVAFAEGALSPSGHKPGVPPGSNPIGCYEYYWGVADICTAIMSAGLALAQLREYPYINGCRFFHRMREIAGHRMIPPEDLPQELPLMLGIVATKPA
ncbi:MAG: class I SAM-dependent methyltransferase [Anaerolineae bacterium]